MSEFEGKVVVVTGAASGIGKASAEQFARLGAKVVVADINEAAVRAVAEEIGEGALAVHVDVSDALSCERMVSAAVAGYGGLDILFNNAGIAGERHYAANQPLDMWRRVIDINLNGVFYCTKYAIPEMQKRGAGVIVNVSSVDGHMGMATVSPYCAAKHGVIGLTKSVALEYGRENIRCVAICPGFVETAMTQSGFNEEELVALAQAIPNAGGTPAQPEQIANLVTWLASDKACYVNGTSVIVDAGLLAGICMEEPT